MRAALARLYGRLREAFGYTTAQIDALSIVEVEEIDLYWKESPPVADVLRSYFGITGVAVESTSAEPRQVSAEELERIAGETRAFAERSGGLRNPYL